MKRLFICMFILSVCAVSCRKQDIRTVVVKVPKLTKPECAKLIQDRFMHHPGIQSVRPDFQAHEVTITYNSMVIALKNIEFVIAGTGFDANDTKAFPDAVKKLPPECR